MSYDEHDLHSMRERTAELIEEGRAELAQSGPKKLTAARLQRVEHLQAKLTEAAALASDLAEEELGGWVPGTPQTTVTPRSDPLHTLAAKLASAVDELERLYA